MLGTPSQSEICCCCCCLIRTKVLIRPSNHTEFKLIKVQMCLIKYSCRICGKTTDVKESRTLCPKYLRLSSNSFLAGHVRGSCGTEIKYLSSCSFCEQKAKYARSHPGYKY